MKIKSSLSILLALGLLGSSPVFADDAGTMEVIDEDSTVEESLGSLTLPDDAPDTAVENARRGLDTANSAREDGREFGASRAAQARERGAQARESGQQRAPDGVRPDGTGNRPAAPGRP